MKLATRKNATRDGQLLVVDSNLHTAVSVPDIAPTLQFALEHWATCYPQLQATHQALNQQHIAAAQPFDAMTCAAPLPRAYQWLDGSAYLSHVRRVRKARGAEMPESFLTDPLMYQGASDDLLGAHDPILLADPRWGADLEGEITIITDDVPQGVSIEDASAHIKLLMLVNDISLRQLIPQELAKGFGFIHGKPASSFSPTAITPDELGAAWSDNRVLLTLNTWLNDKPLGACLAGEGMQFNFAQLVHHAAKTRRLSAGTIIGSGTVSNADTANGCSCLLEKRMLEIIQTGQASTPFLTYGDSVTIDMLDANGMSIFGAIKQEVQPCPS